MTLRELIDLMHEKRVVRVEGIDLPMEGQPLMTNKVSVTLHDSAFAAPPPSEKQQEQARTAFTMEVEPLCACKHPIETSHNMGLCLHGCPETLCLTTEKHVQA